MTREELNSVKDKLDEAATWGLSWAGDGEIPFSGSYIDRVKELAEKLKEYPCPKLVFGRYDSTIYLQYEKTEKDRLEIHLKEMDTVNIEAVKDEMPVTYTYNYSELEKTLSLLDEFWGEDSCSI